jgi:hypothetical protein
VNGAGSLRAAVLTVRFLCELGLLGALAYWGFHTFEGTLGVPIELVLFGAAVVALAAADQVVAAVVLGVAALATSLLNVATESHL